LSDWTGFWIYSQATVNDIEIFRTHLDFVGEIKGVIVTTIRENDSIQCIGETVCTG
jgi:hypothetical protein